MKNIIAAFLVVCSTASFNAQVKTPQQSPKTVINQTVGLTNVELEYSRPSTKGRIIFGDLVPFGKLWRTGANENSVITFSDDVVIDGKTLKKGKYAIYTLPKVENWDVIFYTTTDNWGLPAEWSDANVALKTTVKPESLCRNVDSFTIDINGLDLNSGVLEISWEKALVAVKFEVPSKKAAMASIQKTLAGPTSRDYFDAASYYYQSGEDMSQALTYVNKALELSQDKPFFYLRQKSLIQAKLGDKKGAIETAKLSLAAAQKANNMDYVKMNQESISAWSK